MTTDRHLLKEHGVDHVYRVKELEESESYELFNWAAFNQACLPEGFAELSRQVVAYCGGLPLALELLGLYLHGSEVLKWKGVLRSLERFSIPSGQLVEALEKSFRYLSDEEKQIFLDIACFLIGMNQNDVLQTLNMSMQCTTLQISLLEDKSFVTIDENNKLQMHVMQQAMARDIVTRQSSKKTDQMSGYLPSNMGLFDRPPHASTTRLVRSADIKNIVERVTRFLDKTELFVTEHPVGVESCVEASTKLLNIQNSEDVLLLGIWGMGGMGKTNIAKAIYNQIGSKFEGRSFLLIIREFWETCINLVSLQQQVLCDVYKTTTFKIRDIESRKNILKERLAQSKVLLVLDDVNELDQLKALCGSYEWFGPGSRVIITTRDMHLLRSCRVDRVYAIQEMDESESLELFSWHAFKLPIPVEDFAAHSEDVIVYSGRLPPLALEVLGCYLSDCEITEWQNDSDFRKCTKSFK
ncbi:LOW QUALITY PROTEIN: TMV resistance protein N [Medicago truncatula]|uniref:LOW QUALITY PROTEIN: TMV resistance protein N n=1 Tax=Medicago truncatula TaxID=3880 RepID=UPI001967E4B4|nr:LOW QUALITY PROTEIN: TMV resistance protein N [Medicago truncatula]